MKKMKRVVLVVLDGVGCGAQPDAEKYGDVGANTLGHVYTQQNPDIPNLAELGLLAAAGLNGAAPPTARSASTTSPSAAMAA